MSTPRPVVSGNVPATCTRAALVILITNQAISGRLRVLPRSFSHDPSLLSHSQVADDAARSVIVPAVAAGILLARETSARIAGIADGTRPPAVILAILEDEVAVFAPRNRGDDGARLHSD